MPGVVVLAFVEIGTNPQTGSESVFNWGARVVRQLFQVRITESYEVARLLAWDAVTCAA